MIHENDYLVLENKELQNKINDYEDLEYMFDWYNKMTTTNINSLVLVESKKLTGGYTLYSDGVVIANNGYNYYILTDYNKTKQSGYVEYKITDANANVYNGKIWNNIYDEQTGLAILIVNVSGHNNIAMRTIELGEISSKVGNISNINHINNIQISEKVKTSIIDINNTSYNVYSFEDLISNNGAMINIDNKLCGLYLYNINGFASMDLIRIIVYSNYSIIL